MAQQPEDVQYDPSRMPRLERAPVSAEEHREVYRGPVRNPAMQDVGMRTLMWNRDVANALAPLGDYLRSSQCLPRREREIAILRHAWKCGADFQWGMHAILALDEGLTSDDVDRIPLGADADGWTPPEQAVIRAVDELHAATRVGDETWAAFAAQYDERQIIELFVLVGQYRMLAYMMNSVGVLPPDGESPDLPGNSFAFTPGRGSRSRG